MDPYDIYGKEIDPVFLQNMNMAFNRTEPTITNGNYIDYPNCRNLYLDDWVEVSCNVTMTTDST